MSQYKKLGLNSLLIFIGNLGSKLIVFLMLPFYTKFLSPQQFGKIDLIMSYISLIIPIITMTVTEAVFRLPVGKDIEDKKKYFSNAFFMGNIGIVLSFLCLKLLLLFELDVLKIIEIKNQYILIVFFIFNYTLLQQFLRGIDKIKYFSISGILYSFIFTVLNIFLIKRYSLDGYFYSILYSNLFMVIYIGFILKVYKYLDFNKISIKKIQEILIYTVPLVPTSIIWWIINLSDRLILSYYYGDKALGIYTLSNRFALIISTVFGIFYTSWQISAVEEFEKKNYVEFYTNIFKAMEIILVFLNIFLVIFLKSVLPLFINTDYMESIRYIPILMLGTIYSNFAAFIGVNYIVLKKTKFAFYTGFLIALLNIFLNFVLIPKNGVMGASLATLISYICFFIFRKYNTENIAKLKLSNLEIIYTISINLYLCFIIDNIDIKKIILFCFGVYIYININKIYLKKVLNEVRKKIGILKLKRSLK